MPNLWIFTGCPNRAKAISKMINKSASIEADIYDPFFQIWIVDDIGVCACGMGRASIDYAVKQISKFYQIDKAIRIGTAGTRDKNLLGKLVAIQLAQVQGELKTYCASLFPLLPLTNCFTVDLLYQTHEGLSDYPLEDMETAQLFKLGQSLNFDAGAILYAANTVGRQDFHSHPYAVFSMVQSALTTLRG